MRRTRRKRWLALALTLALAAVLCPMLSPAAGIAGYRAVAAWDMDFLAVGDGGRVTVLSVDGARRELSAPAAVSLQDVLVRDGTAWIVGAGGTVLTLTGEVFGTRSVDGAPDLLSIAWFDGTFFLGGRDGALYRGTGDGNWTRVPLAATGDVVGLAAGERRLIGVTAAGETFTYTPRDGFSVQNYNAAAGDSVAFHAVACDSAGATFWATGVRADGSPALLHTAYGGIWGERALTYMDGAGYDPSGLSLRGIAPAGQQMVAACGDGQLLTLPDCAECNKLQRLGDASLTAVCYNGGAVAAVGEDFSVLLTDDETVRQYRVSAATAHQMQQEGAVIIDVRERADYIERHIAGSLSIPLGELETRLPELVRDCETPVIFYCAKGVRSQTAVERAWKMEYYNAFSLGGIDRWEYEFASGAPEDPSGRLFGDVDGSGTVDTADAVQVLQRTAGLIGDADWDKTAADVNGDGAIDTADAVLILQRAAEVIDRFPVEQKGA